MKKIGGLALIGMLASINSWAQKAVTFQCTFSNGNSETVFYVMKHAEKIENPPSRVVSDSNESYYTYSANTLLLNQDHHSLTSIPLTSQLSVTPAKNGLKADLIQFDVGDQIIEFSVTKPDEFVRIGTFLDTDKLECAKTN